MQQPWPEVPAHLGAPRWVAIDCVVAALGLAIVALLSRAQLGPGGPTWADGVIIGASLAAAGLRRRWPRAVLPLIVVLGAAATWTGASAVVAFAVAFVMYLIPQRFARREALWLLAGTLVATAIAATASLRGLLGPPGPPSRTSPGLVVVGLLVITVAWTIGYAVQQQRLHAAARQEQAAQQAHEALAEARRAMSEERLRIARELHDVVAHTLSVIAVQAGVANHVAAEHPGEAQRALSSIEETSRGALQEMRALLGVLRGEEGSAPDVFGAAPAPGLDDLDALVERAGEAGVRVDLQIRGTRADLSAGLELAAYRVVQEAITNVIKHSGADGCRVTVAYHREVFTVEVADDGANPAGPAAGHGIAGMRERVAMYGGEFHAGPASPRGFRIAATFPLAAP